MSLILAFIFGLWFFGIVILDKEKHITKAERYKKNFPSTKKQEEYLLVCKHYFECLQDPHCEDPKAEALYLGRMDIYNQGFLPTPLEYIGRDGLSKRSYEMREHGFGITAEFPPDYRHLEKLREEDFHSFRTNYLHDFDRPYPKWQKYCNEMDELYKDLSLKCANYLLKFNRLDVEDWMQIDKKVNPVVVDECDQNYELDLTRGVFDGFKQQVIEEAKTLTLDEFADRYKDSVFWQYRKFCKDYLVLEIVRKRDGQFIPTPISQAQRDAHDMTMEEFKAKYGDTPFWRYRIYCKDYH